MIGTCDRGHLTGYKICYCGARRVSFSPGEGKVNVSKVDRPRDLNGVNELEKLRIKTRVGKTIPKFKQLQG